MRHDWTTLLPLMSPTTRSVLFYTLQVRSANPIPTYVVLRKVNVVTKGTPIATRGSDRVPGPGSVSYKAWMQTHDIRHIPLSPLNLPLLLSPTPRFRTVPDCSGLLPLPSGALTTPPGIAPAAFPSLSGAVATVTHVKIRDPLLSLTFARCSPVRTST